ncbi:MAG: hypothetical protein GZ091_15280 [Paludibacter sp.]|nr:hypothetical protein [Paludibacter sp.]
MVNCNEITILYEGHYQLILDFNSKLDIIKILDTSYIYVWGINHVEDSVNWATYNHTLYEHKTDDYGIQVRNIQMEFLIKTQDFVNFIPFIKQTINIIQTNKVPPYYLNLNRLKGKGKYDLLKKEINYLFELEVPGASDYITIISPDIDFLKSIKDKFSSL